MKSQGWFFVFNQSFNGVQQAHALQGEGIVLLVAYQIDARDFARILAAGKVDLLAVGIVGDRRAQRALRRAEPLVGRIAERIGQAADGADGVGLLALLVEVREAVELLGQGRDLLPLLGGVEVAAALIGEDRDGGRFADEEVLLQEPHALDALAPRAELGKHVVGDGHVQSVPGRDRQHEETADQDHPRMGNDQAGEAVPEMPHQAPRPASGCPGRRRSGTRTGLDDRPAAGVERPEDRAAKGPQQGRGHGHAGQEGHDQRDGDRRSAGTVFAEVGDHHRPQPEDRRHGAGGQGVPGLAQGLFQGGPRHKAMLDFLAVAGDQEEAIVGRRAEEYDDDEDLGRLEDLKVELLPSDAAADPAQQLLVPFGPLGDQGDDVDRGEIGNADRQQRHQHQSRSAIDDQQNDNHQQDRHELRVLNALLHRIEHVGADGGRTGHAQLQAGGEVRFLLDLLHLVIDPLDEGHVVDGHQLGAQLQDHQRGLAVRTFAANELLADDLLVGSQDRQDGRLFALLRLVHLGQSGSNRPVFTGEPPVRSGEDQHDVALGRHVGEGPGQQFLATDAGHRRREIGEIAVVGDIVPFRRDAPQLQGDYHPGDEHRDPVS